MNNPAVRKNLILNLCKMYNTTKIPHEKIVFGLKIGIIWSSSYTSILLIMGAYGKLFPTTAIGKEIAKILIKDITPYILLISLCLSLFYYLSNIKEPQIVEYNKKKINSHAIFLDYYSLLLPLFFVLLPIALLLLIMPYYPKIYIYEFFLIVYSFGLLLLILLLFSKIAFDKDAERTFKMANDIFANYLYENEDYRKRKFYVKKFSSYFNMSISNIDRHLLKSLKIENLEHEAAFPIKHSIKKYLNVYLMYCTQNEIKDLNHNLNSISSLIDIKSKRPSLEITNHIFKVYICIKDFLSKRNYKIHVGKISRFLNFNFSFHYSLLFLLFFASTLSVINNALVEQYDCLTNLFIENYKYLYGNFTPSEVLSIITYSLQIVIFILTIAHKILK
jgi:hypothetical protein